ncbi:MAG: SDR family oxidoreductase [Ignavibacteriales bacterium]|nr:SDR family oxidoreductase [Ignavibacteriales bacterium]
MKRILLVFGSSGALGTGACSTLLAKGYDEYHFFDVLYKKNTVDGNEFHHPVQDLRIKENVHSAFSIIPVSADAEYFLFTTIGGYAGGDKIEDTRADDLINMQSMNYYANFWIVQEFIAIVKQAKGGSICFTAAMTGLEPGSGTAVYGASKAALLYITEVAAIEGKEYNMSANVLAPYIIDTPANRSWVEAAGIDHETLMKPEEIGGLIDNLFTNYRFISGNTIKLRYRFPKL